MKIVLLSGGSGKRLWPLSDDIRSKQFLKVVRNDEGEFESMLQRIWRQLQSLNFGMDVTITSGLLQSELIQKQLQSGVQTVIEPERRDTFPAIALSAAYLYFEKNCPDDETLIVLPVDLYVEDNYFNMLSELDMLIQSGFSDIAIIGVKPTYPSEKYGYIIPEHSKGTASGIEFPMKGKEKNTCMLFPVFPVLEFKEKPDINTAQEFIKMGGLWNCGVFAFKISYIMKIIRSMIRCDCYDDIKKQYSKLERKSFDYVVLEKTESVSVVDYDGEWKDLGTWDTLVEIMQDKTVGEMTISENCENTHVINELGIPIVVVGTKDIVIVATSNGILVSDKTQSSDIKKYIRENK